MLILIISESAFALFYLSKYIFVTNELARFGVMFDLLSGNVGLADVTNRDKCSLGVRMDMWIDSLRYVKTNAIGTGLGGWKFGVTKYHGIYYPHNLFCEL